MDLSVAHAMVRGGVRISALTKLGSLARLLINQIGISSWNWKVSSLAQAGRPQNGRGQQDTAGSSKNQLLRAASDLMVDRGSVDVTLIDIAQRSGLNAALIKYYFGNKVGLLAALLESILGTAVVEMRQMLTLDLPPEKKLRLHISGMARTYFKYPYISALIHAVSQDEKAAERITSSVTTPLIQAQRQLLDEGMAAGAFRTVDPMIFYFIVVGACDHFFFKRRLLKSAFSINHISKEIAASLENTLTELVLSGIMVDKA